MITLFYLKNFKEAFKDLHGVMKVSAKPKYQQKNKSSENMTYTEEELLQAIKYACEYQKATDYQTACKLLIVDESELSANSILLLDELANDNNAFCEIELKDIFK